MSKIDLNSATRDDLVIKAGIRPPAAAAILKHRAEKGPFAAVDDLMSVSGIGSATFEQIKGLLMVPAALTEAAVEMAPEPAPAMIKLAETEILQVVECGREVAPAATDMAEKAATTNVDALHELTVATTEAASPVVGQGAVRVPNDIASMWLDLAAEQMSHGMESLQAVMAARTLPELVEAQNGFIRGSMARFLEATNRCMRLSQGLASSFKIQGRAELDTAA